MGTNRAGWLDPARGPSPDDPDLQFRNETEDTLSQAKEEGYLDHRFILLPRAEGPAGPAP
jgi:hypothetical protein